MKTLNLSDQSYEQVKQAAQEMGMNVSIVGEAIIDVGLQGNLHEAISAVIDRREQEALQKVRDRYAARRSARQT